MSEPRKLIVVSGPSGVGKTTVIDILCRIGPFTESISATTRPPRGGERDGVHYHFLSPGEFEARRSRGEFLESATYRRARYGTLRSEVERIRREGRYPVLGIDVQGALQLMERGEEAVYVFLAPPDMDTLEERLRARGTDSDEEILARLETARHEMTLRDRYDRVVVNRVAREAAAEIRALVEPVEDPERGDER